MAQNGSLNKKKLNLTEGLVKSLVLRCIVWFLSFILWFRYRVTVKGIEKLNKTTLNKTGGTLFLPNHPTVFVDPILAALTPYPKFKVRPMIVEYMYYLPVVNWLMRFIDAIPIPNFDVSSNSLKRKKSEAIITKIIEDLRRGDNILIYPSGRVKHTALEIIGGASGVHRILQEVPEANVVLMRTKGLWGSSFSRALTGRTPPMFKTVLQGMKYTFKNLLFFNPRRKVIIEMEPAPPDFPWNASRVELNKWLENYYNRPDGMSPQKGKYPGESLMLIPYSMWSKKLPEAHEPPAGIDATISINDIPEDIKQKVLRKVAEMQGIPESTIKPDMSFASDLGMDSLDIAELVVFLNDQFDIEGVPAVELTTVSKMMAIASKKIVVAPDVEEEEKDISKWNRPVSKKLAVIPEGDSFPEVFLKTCENNSHKVACGDFRTGVMTYRELKLRAILLAEKFRHVPGKYIGVLLPASVGASLITLACQLAGKVPVMINWTVGPRHLETVVKLSQVKAVYTSWAFLDRLHNVELDGIEDILITLEDFRKEISFFDKIQALWRSKKSVSSILKIFNLDKLTGEEEAVLLFTSGTESMPKGVPLTHHNILKNMRAGLQTLEVYTDDVLYAVLPPFHSFGLFISLLGVLAGIRTAYFPDPTDGKRLAKNFQKWKATIGCFAPTFLKGMLKITEIDQIKTMRLCITGAEKAPRDMLQLLDKFGKLPCFLEGYGITECSPVLTLTRPGKPLVGVGQPLPGVELMIVSLEDDTPLPVGQHGLILARGPNIFKGYLNPGLSSPFATIEGKEWYRTGDLGFLDEEGNLTISGRLKRFIKVGGEMVSLASIEDALLQMAAKNGWPTSEEGPTLAICAKELPNEKPKIYLFSRFESSVDEVNKSLKESGFSNLVKVTSVTQLPEIPVMGTGKINYRALENSYLT